MDEAKLGEIYQQIAKTIVDMIPEIWEKVYLYGEVTEGVSQLYFFYYPTNNSSPVYFLNIPELFGISESVFDELKDQLFDYLEKLWNEFNKNDQEPWTNLTFILDSSGKFKIDFDYEDLSDKNPRNRRII